MSRLFCIVTATLILCFVSASAAPEEEWKQKLQNAEAQLTATYAQVEAQLDAAQTLKLQAAQKAWDEYRKLAFDWFVKESEGYSDRGEEANDTYSASLTWSRVSHLSRMLAPRDLNGSESEFRDADDAINRVYKLKRHLLGRRESCEALKKVQLVWIRYRDAAAESESSVCPNPPSAAVYIKTELTYERASSLKAGEYSFARRLATAPPDLEKELSLALLRSENADIRQKAVDFFRENANESLPLLIAQFRTGLLPVQAAPIFERLGPVAIPPLLELIDKRAYVQDSPPVFLAATGPAVIPDLIPRISSTYRGTSQMSMSALALLGANAKDAVPALLDIINRHKTGSQEEAWRSRSAAQAILNIAPDNSEVVKTIVDAYLASPANDETFTSALSKLGPAAKEALPTLIDRALDSRQGSEAPYALHCIISPEDTELIPSLTEGLINPGTYDWMGFGLALAKIGDSAVPPLKTLLQSQDKMVVRRAATTLVRIGHPPDDVIATLISLSNEEDVSEAIFFIDILAQYGESAKAAVPTLLNLYRSNRPGVSAAALNALHSIAPDSEEVKRIWLPDPYVLDPFYDARSYSESNLTDFHPPEVLEADFNNDGLMDIAICIGMGNSFGGWNLYLKAAEHKYKWMGDFEAPRHVTLYTKEKGVGYLGVYWHASAWTGTEGLFKITMDELSLAKSVDVEAAAGGGVCTVNSDEALPIPKGYTETRLSAKAIEKETLLGK